MRRLEALATQGLLEPVVQVRALPQTNELARVVKAAKVPSDLALGKRVRKREKANHPGHDGYEEKARRVERRAPHRRERGDPSDEALFEPEDVSNHFAHSGIADTYYVPELLRAPFARLLGVPPRPGMRGHAAFVAADPCRPPSP